MNSKNLIVGFISIIVFLLVLYFGKNYFGIKMPWIVNNTDIQNTSEPSSSEIPEGNVGEEKVVDLQSSHFLNVVSPVDQEIVRTKSLNVLGETTPGAEVFVNDKEVKANSEGDFSVNLSLEEGDNTIVVISNDKDGNYIEKEITIIYEP